MHSSHQSKLEPAISKGTNTSLLIPFCEKTATVRDDAQTTPSPASEKHSDDLKINKNPQQTTSAATIDPSAEHSSNPSTEYIEAEERDVVNPMEEPTTMTESIKIRHTRTTKECY